VGKIEIQLFRLGLSQLVSVVNIVVYRNVGRIEIQLFRLGLSQLVSVVNRQVNCGSEGNSGGSGCGGVALGLRRSLVKKIYPLRPRTCAEFLELVKIHTETTILLDKRSWEERNDPVPPTAAISMVREEKSTWQKNLNLEKILMELQKTIEDFKTHKKVDWNSPIVTNWRPANERRECYFCT
jgi:hypothetical protein